MERAIAKGKQYTDQQIRDALKLAEEIGVYPASEKLGIHFVLLYEWRRKAKARGYDADTYTKHSTPTIDISNQRFGKLIAISPVEKHKKLGVMWLCKCDCGGEVIASAGRITSGARRSCGCSKELTLLAGQKFGRLTVLEDIRVTGQNPKARCLCDCGKETIVIHASLLSGNTRSCGCLHSDVFVVRREGQRVGRLTVLEEAGRNDRQDVYWRCRCDCGKETVVRSSHLADCSIKSCGCLIIEHNVKQMAKHKELYLHEQTNLLFLNNNLSKNNTTGVRGVTYDKRRDKYRAMIIFQNKKYHLGSFKTLAEAAEARRQAEQELYDPILLKYGFEPTSEEYYQAALKAALERLEDSESNDQ